MSKKTITVLMVEPNKHPKITQLATDLDSLQKAVSIGASYQGLIELVELGEGICLLCNEEGKVIGLPGNRSIGRDVIDGVFYVVGSDPYGNLISLTEQQIEDYKAFFWEPEVLSEQDVNHALFMRFFSL